MAMFAIISLLFGVIIFACGCSFGYTHRRQRNAEMASKYYELIFAVSRKFCGESRHETALRYIIEAERGSTNMSADGVIWLNK